MTKPSGQELAHVGYVALVGRPNVGKSTLLNHILGQKISITTHKPQTTRHQIIGIKTGDDSQVIYVDTPGIHKHGGRAINRAMNRAAHSVFHDVDVVVMIVDGDKWGEEDDLILGYLSDISKPVILVINKVDRIADKQKLLPVLERHSSRYPFYALIPISARQGKYVDEFEGMVTQLLPAAPALFPDDQITDRSERFLAAEIVREKLMRQLGQELPYALTVEIESFQDGPEVIDISALIWVERAAHKAMVIGNQGARLKDIGTQARKDMEVMFGKRVFLQLWVKVREGWTDDERALRRFGYGEHG